MLRSICLILRGDDGPPRDSEQISLILAACLILSEAPPLEKGQILVLIVRCLEDLVEVREDHLVAFKTVVGQITVLKVAILRLEK